MTRKRISSSKKRMGVRRILLHAVRKEFPEIRFSDGEVFTPIDNTIRDDIVYYDPYFPYIVMTFQSKQPIIIEYLDEETVKYIQSNTGFKTVGKDILPKEKKVRLTIDGVSGMPISYTRMKRSFDKLFWQTQDTGLFYSRNILYRFSQGSMTIEYIESSKTDSMMDILDPLVFAVGTTRPVDIVRTKRWFEGTSLHREDGPAVIYPDGNQEFWIHGKEISRDWFLFVQEYPTMSKKQLKERLEHLYKSGWPVPVDPNEEHYTEYGLDRISQVDLQHFAISAEEHRECYNDLSNEMKKLLRNWVVGDYASFNTNVSFFNGEPVQPKVVSKKFLGDFEDSVDAYVALRETIFSISVSTHRIFAWRGVNYLKELCDSVKIHDIVGFSRFTACSISQEVACDFAKLGIVFLIELPPGTNFFNLTCFKRAQPEILLPDRCCFQVVNRFKPIIQTCFGISCPEFIHLKYVGVYSQDKKSMERILENNTQINLQDMKIW